MKEGRHKASGTRVAIKIVDKKDAVFDPESLEQEVGAQTVTNCVGVSCCVRLEHATPSSMWSLECDTNSSTLPFVRLL